MSDLLEKLNVNMGSIKQMCPSIFGSPETSSLSTYDIDFASLTPQIDDTLMYQKQYYAKVEEGNKYINELKEIEKTYFEKKYGPNIYKYIENKRDDHNLNEINKRFDTSSDIKNVLYDLSKNMQIYNDISGTTNSSFELITNNMSTMYDELTQLKNEIAVNERKVQYRHEVSDDVVEYSTQTTYLYYFIIVCIFIYLFSQNQLNIGDHYLLYGLAIILPFLYRFFFLGLVYVYNRLHDSLNIHGPKNAFIDENVKSLTFLDDYNV